jgi:hypothetical protein
MKENPFNYTTSKELPFEMEIERNSNKQNEQNIVIG